MFRRKKRLEETACPVGRAGLTAGGRLAITGRKAILKKWCIETLLTFASLFNYKKKDNDFKNVTC